MVMSTCETCGALIHRRYVAELGNISLDALPRLGGSYKLGERDARCLAFRVGSNPLRKLHDLHACHACEIQETLSALEGCDGIR